MASNKSFIVYLDYLQYFETMSPEEVGMVMLALFSFAANGDDTEFEDRTLNLVYQVMRNQLVRDKEKYMKVCATNSENGKKGGRGHKKSDSDDEDTNESEIDRTAQLINEYGRIDNERNRR